MTNIINFPKQEKIWSNNRSGFLLAQNLLATIPSHEIENFLFAFFNHLNAEVEVHNGGVSVTLPKHVRRKSS